METTNLSKIKRDKMLDTINELKKKITDENTLTNLSLIENELTKKKYGLIWEEHQERVDKELETQIPTFEEIKDKEILSNKDEKFNFLLEGDNLHSLYLLNKTHNGKIDVIFIDPPYNTGAKSWKYNNAYVDINDGYKHSKWISFMSNRLKYAKELLSDDGVIIVTIDDYEIHTLGLLMDEIFGEENHMSTLIVESNPRGRTSDPFFATSHEYYLYYAKNASKVKFFNMELSDEQKQAFKLEDEISPYRLLPLRKSGAASRRHERPTQFYPIYVRKSDLEMSTNKFEEECVEVWPIDKSGEERVWRFGIKNCEENLRTHNFIAKEKEDGKYTIYQKDRIKMSRKPKTMWIDPKYDASAHGTILISNILGKRNTFDYPKSLYAVIDSLNVLLREKKDAIVLDFFAGSGTTGHAVLELNQEDNGNRKFILCTNNENDICEDITYKRILNVINGYGKYKAIPSNLKYYRCTYIPRINIENENLHSNLLINIKNLIQLENGIEVDDNKIRIYLNEDELDTFSNNKEAMNVCDKVYISSDILLTSKQEKIFEDNNIEVYIIPE